MHPEIPEELRGTYAGLAHPAAIAHLRSIDVTAVELMPVHHFLAHLGHLSDTGLRNYWGYDSLNFFAPYSSYSASGHYGEQVREFKEMVKALHRAGIEVILDVVYNHTGEGNQMGPTLTLRGVDNAAYYRLVEDNPPLLHGFHWVRQLAQRPPSAGTQADHGQPALLGAGDARRRLSLRSRQHAR